MNSHFPPRTIRLRVLDLASGSVTRGQPIFLGTEAVSQAIWVDSWAGFVFPLNFASLCFCLITPCHWIWIMRVSVSGWGPQVTWQMRSQNWKECSLGAKHRVHVAHQEGPNDSIQDFLPASGRQSKCLFSRGTTREGNEFPAPQLASEVDFKDQNDKNCWSLYFPDHFYLIEMWVNCRL